jgi:hypothetical protein
MNSKQYHKFSKRHNKRRCIFVTISRIEFPCKENERIIPRILCVSFLTPPTHSSVRVILPKTTTVTLLFCWIDTDFVSIICISFESHSRRDPEECWAISNQNWWHNLPWNHSSTVVLDYSADSLEGIKGESDWSLTDTLVSRDCHRDVESDDV